MAKIYVVEDDKDIRDLIEWVLESENFEVMSFENVKKFDSRDITKSPDLYILDVMLPDGSGIDVCNQLKSEKQSQIPILIMSAHASLAQITNGCKANGFIQKPFELNFFLDKIRDQMSDGHKLE